MPPAFQQFIVFAGVGAIGTAGHYAVLILLVEWLGVAPTPASICGFAVGAVINYALNYHVTFASRRRHSHTLPRFLAIAAVGALINTAIMHLGTETFAFNYLLCQLAATGCVLVFGYIANRLWTFAREMPE
jgi:putative flippase GtrA